MSGAAPFGFQLEPTTIQGIRTKMMKPDPETTDIARLLLSLPGPGRTSAEKQTPERPNPCGGSQRGAGIGGCAAPLPEKADGKHHVPERAQGEKYLAGRESEVWPLWVRLNERGEPVRRSIPAMLQAGGQQKLSGLWDAPHKGI